MASLTLALVLFAALRAQETVRNPREGDPIAIRAGAALYAERCADCHGADAKGVRGPDLTGLWSSGTAEVRVFQTIRLGVAGSIMPPSPAPDADIWAIVAYLKSISVVKPGVVRGNAERGGQLFSSSCLGCHRAGGRGGRLGPDLTRIGERQPRSALVRSIREPGASIASGYQGVILTTRDGRQIRGARKNEDAFSVQIMDTRERLQGFLKADLRGVERDPRSLMPDFGADRLSDSDLEDVLTFLSTVRAVQN